MAGYRSNPGGLYNSGVVPDSRPQIDIGGLLEAAGAGTGSIIHAVMARRLAQNQMQTQQAELGLRQQQAAREDAATAWQQKHQQATLDQATLAEHHRFLEAGGVPEHTEDQPTYGSVATGQTMPIQSLAPVQSPVRKAMASGLQRSGPPSTDASALPVSVVGSTPAPVASPSAPVVTEGQTGTRPVKVGETVDPSRNIVTQRALSVASARAASAEALLDKRDADAAARATAAQQAHANGLNAMAASREKIAQWNNASRSNIHGAMTGAAKNKAMVSEAQSLLDEHYKGDINQFLSDLHTTPEGRAYAAAGITDDVARQAHTAWFADNEKQQAAAAKQAASESGKNTDRVLHVMTAATDSASATPGGAAAKVAAAGMAASRLKKPGTTVPVVDPKAAAAAWKKANPRGEKESDDDYFARFTAANPPPKPP